MKPTWLPVMPANSFYCCHQSLTGNCSYKNPGSSWQWNLLPSRHGQNVTLFYGKTLQWVKNTSGICFGFIPCPYLYPFQGRTISQTLQMGICQLGGLFYFSLSGGVPVYSLNSYECFSSTGLQYKTRVTSCEKEQSCIQFISGLHKHCWKRAA